MKIVLICCCLFLFGCASTSRQGIVKNIQPQINSLVAASYVQKANHLLSEGSLVYGHHNQLLYWLDYGFSLQLAGRYQESIGALAKARQLVDVLYGRPVSQVMATWLINDSREDYRGEDYEHVLINILQAINYAALNQWEEALVEVRDMQRQLTTIASQYPADYQHPYTQDAFALYFSGILYESQLTLEDQNDALISYVNAYQAYDDYYQKHFALKPPADLVKHISQLTHRLGNEMRQEVERRLPDVVFTPMSQAPTGRLVMVYYTGFVPIKVADMLLLPIDRNSVTKISWPVIFERDSQVCQVRVSVSNSERSLSYMLPVVEPIGAIATAVLKQKQTWLMTKAITRPAIKYALAQGIENYVNREHGQWQSDVVGVLGSLYALSTEEADTRSWQTLPADIRLASIDLPAGQWQVVVEDLDCQQGVIARQDLGVVAIKINQTQLRVLRSYH